MAALTRDRLPATADRQQTADAEAGAWPDHPDRLARLGRPAADLLALVDPQRGDRHRLGGEVVDHVESLEPKAGPRRADRERPGELSAPPGRR